MAPRTDEEVKLAEIWKNILKVPSVGVRDNFFELGGHSLLAAQLVSQVKAQFGIHDRSLALDCCPYDRATGRKAAPVLRRTARRGRHISLRFEKLVLSLRFFAFMVAAAICLIIAI